MTGGAWARRGIALVLALGLAACEVPMPSIPTFGKEVRLPPCPQVEILTAAGSITQFRPGPGRDITDIIHESELVGYSGECEFLGDSPDFTAVNVIMRPVIDISRGPAADGRAVEVRYFVAIPEFFPRPEGRSEFALRAVFPENRNTMRLRDEEVVINIPLADDRKSGDVTVYLGFVLTPDQLEFNRNRSNQQTGRGS